jgi:hypothetical protein
MLKSIVDGFKDSNVTLQKVETEHNNLDVKYVI